MRVHPFHDPTYPEVGLFAFRSPTRPNPIGLSRVRLIERRDNVLVVKGLDAYNGTPVLDIKPATRWDQVYKREK
jgi:tRNA (Thr-GGU) A37 N-methylase